MLTIVPGACPDRSIVEAQTVPLGAVATLSEPAIGAKVETLPWLITATPGPNNWAT